MAIPDKIKCRLYVKAFKQHMLKCLAAKNQRAVWTACLLWLSACGLELPQQTLVVEKPLLVDCTTPIVTTEGKVRGRADRLEACTYQGIPFAAPPTGVNRWRAPQPALPYGMLDASTFQPDCPQLGAIQNLAPAGSDEDCLHLNIWRPAVDHGFGVENLPVMVFIYGGAFQIGGGSWFLYEGTDLVKHGVVVVTINYRLGPLGYMANEHLASEDPNGSTGAYGTLDQIAALEWIQANIANFGGDPNNVTVFGESAGAMSTCQMISSPLATGLFKRAIMQSGNCSVGEPALSYAKTVSYIAHLGCEPTSPTVTDCLRSKTPEQAWSAVSLETAFAFWPHIDGYVLPTQPISAVVNGTANKVDLIAGYNDDEFTVVKVLPVFSQTRNISFDAFWNKVATVFSAAEVQTLRAAYDQSRFNNPVELWFDVLEDLLFTCASMQASQALYQQGKNTYVYNFSVEPDAYKIEPYAGSFHSLELSFVFGNYEFLQLFFHNQDAAARIVAHSERVQRYWTRFARSGDPNGGSDPHWPVFGDKKITLSLDENPNPLIGEKALACAFWNARLPHDNDGLFNYMANTARALDFYDDHALAQNLPF